eukprot:snap_masked-scaffold_14-processed-gene-11.7-mRNA-1 protein AED:1.00 eAED:1.00 QI:0/-1/0/0/-1/1/1/0/395
MKQFNSPKTKLVFFCLIIFGLTIHINPENAIYTFQGNITTISDDKTTIIPNILMKNQMSMERAELQVRKNSTGKFFVYQPSGGWGNQIIILLNAITAANSMERTLIIPPVSPHAFLYYGYNKFTAEEMAPMDMIVDIELLETAVDKGILFWNETLFELTEFWKHKSWNIFSKPRYNPQDKEKKHIWTWTNTLIHRKWSKIEDDVVFWNKDGMWLCCSPHMPYISNVGFNQEFRKVAYLIGKQLEQMSKKNFQNKTDLSLNFNAIHVRRGQGHISKDRRTVAGYIESHGLASWERDVVLYIATDTPDNRKNWFLPFVQEFSFQKVLFWEDLYNLPKVKDTVEQLVSKFHPKMKRDIEGFIEQLICSYASKFEGSRASTFSVAIQRFRRNSQLLEIK